MNKIFLHNFPQTLAPFAIEAIENTIDGRSAVDCLAVEEYFPPNGPVISELRSDILTALILHDKLCIDKRDVLHLIHLFGIDDCIKLFQSKAFEIYDDLGPRTGAIIQSDDSCKLVIMKVKEDILASIEENLKRLSALPKNDINIHKIKRILTLLVSNTSIPSTEFVDSRLFDETGYDIGNKNVTELFGITSSDCGSIKKADLPIILRVNHINSGLLKAERVNTGSVLTDNWAKTFMLAKLSPIMKESKHDSVDVFKSTILSNKGIPDLNHLFANKIIKAEDIIEFRDNPDGKRFRDWMLGTEYDPKMILETLLNKKPPSVKDGIIKTARFLIPKVLGIVGGPLTGFALGVIDSFIVERILNGWNPSLFLDDRFKFVIDRKIKLAEGQAKLAELEKINGKIEGDDPCPCGSGKEFKKCCRR